MASTLILYLFFGFGGSDCFDMMVAMDVLRGYS